jgi:hypothetical protein
VAQSEDLVETLKRQLRRRRVTYADVARSIGKSESSVKRLFSTGGFTLKGLQQVCETVGLELSDLANLAEEQRRDVDELTEQQERTLVDDPKLLLVAFLLLNFWIVEQITESYAIEELEMVQLLAKLDRLGILDLLPGNNVRMRVSHNFAWRKNGPIQKLFDKHIQTEFLRSRFEGPGELRLVVTGMIGEPSLTLMHQRMQRLASDFEQCVHDDRRSVGPDRLGTTLVMAIRPWALGMFEAYRRGER